MGNHQILEVRKEQREKGIDASSLWIFVKIFDNQVCFVHIAVDNGVAQLESVKILAHSYLVFDHLRRHSPIRFGQRDDDLFELAGQSTQVGADAVGNELSRLGVDAHLTLFEVALDEGWQITVAQFLTLEEDACLTDGLDILTLPAVDGAVFVAEHKNGLGRRLFEVILQLVSLLQVLRFLDDDHLPLGHHGVTAGGVGYLGSSDVGTE